MKKIIIAIIAALAVVSSSKVKATESQVSLTRIYPLSTVVTSLESEKDSVIVEDCNGNLWEFTGIEDWQIGDRCSLIMDNSGTDTIYDDVILKAKYDGEGR